jgi:hypothetical protein
MIQTVTKVIKNVEKDNNKFLHNSIRLSNYE